MSASAAVLAQPFIKSRVYLQLKELASAASFYKWRVNPQTGVPSVQAVDGDKVALKGFNANEIQSTFEESRNMRSRRMQRAQIAWEMVLEFAEAAITEVFETTVSDLEVTRIPASGSIPQLDLLFERSEFSNPPVGQSSTGTKVKYTIVVNVGKN